MSPGYLKVSHHAVCRYRERVLSNKSLIMSNDEIREHIKNNICPSFKVLGKGVYPIQGDNCFCIIRSHEVVTIMNAPPVPQCVPPKESR